MNAQIKAVVVTAAVVSLLSLYGTREAAASPEVSLGEKSAVSQDQITFPEIETNLTFERRSMLPLPEAPKTAPAARPAAPRSARRPALSVPASPAAAKKSGTAYPEANLKADDVVPTLEASSVPQSLSVPAGATAPAAAKEETVNPALTLENLVKTDMSEEEIIEEQERTAGQNQADFSSAETLLDKPAESGEESLEARLADPDRVLTGASLRQTLGEPLSLFDGQGDPAALKTSQAKAGKESSLGRNFMTVLALLTILAGVGYALVSRKKERVSRNRYSDPLSVHFSSRKPAPLPVKTRGRAEDLLNRARETALTAEPRVNLKRQISEVRRAAMASQESRRQQRGEEFVRRMSAISAAPYPESDEIGFLPPVEKHVRRMKFDYSRPNHEEPLSAMESSPLYREVPVSMAPPSDYRESRSSSYAPVMDDPYETRIQPSVRRPRPAEWEEAAYDYNTPSFRDDQVRMLFDEGLSTSAIARRLAMGRGEVELILGLHSRAREQAGPF